MVSQLTIIKISDRQISLSAKLNFLFVGLRTTYAEIQGAKEGPTYGVH